jgi:2-polyprenyl-3-methyl-5-hydroxy-6-metoxy-1,4-benzoquinol methylase
MAIEEITNARAVVAQPDDEVRFEGIEECPVCHSRDQRAEVDAVEDYLCAIPGKFRYVRCDNCELVYENPRPVVADLPKIYADYHTHEGEALPESFAGAWNRPTQIIRGGILAHKFGYQHLAPEGIPPVFSYLLDLLPPLRSRARCGLGVGAGSELPTFRGEGRALDIGIGAGTYAGTLARLGWKVTGVEFDPVTAENTARRYQLKIFCGTLEDAQFEPNSFDFISMFHVIEHLPDPVATLRECYRVLKPGALMMVATPNYDSLNRITFGRYWRGMEAPRHLCLFNRFSLRRALTEAGLAVTAEVTTRAPTRYYVESSMRFRDQATQKPFNNLTAFSLTKFQNARIVASRLAGRLRGDNLHFEAVKEC